MMDVAELLRQERERRGLFQADIARLVRCHPSSVARWERGQRNPDPLTLMRLGVALGSEPLQEAALRLSAVPVQQALAMQQRWQAARRVGKAA